MITHNRKSAHQVPLIAELTWNTIGGHLILEYEIPKYGGDLGLPSVFVAALTGNAQEQGSSHHERLRDAAHKALA